MRQTKKGRQEVQHEKQAMLAKSAVNMVKINAVADNLDAGINKYYIMTRGQVEALLSGDMKTIEHWINNLDRNRATLLLRWLIKQDSELFYTEAPE